MADEQLFEYQKEIIENLNETESCCIVGKCANDILRHRNNVLSVYIEAPGITAFGGPWTICR